jgi:hypothetical protein
MNMGTRKNAESASSPMKEFPTDGQGKSVLEMNPPYRPLKAPTRPNTAPILVRIAVTHWLSLDSLDMKRLGRPLTANMIIPTVIAFSGI